MSHFLQAANKRMEAKGTKGTFSAAAKRRGMSTEAFAEKELHDPNASPKMKKRANFARNAIHASHG